MGNELVTAQPEGGDLAAPDSWEAAGKFVDECIANEVVPKSYESMPAPKRRGNMIVAIVKGRELGMTPLQALQSIYVVNGIPTIWGDAMVLYVMRTGMLRAYSERIEGEGDARKAIVRVERHGISGFIERTFSVADAAAQKLLTKIKDGPWTHSRDRMLMIRARTYAFRDMFADAFPGLAIREEQEDLARTLHGAVVDSGATAHVDPLADPPARAQIVQEQAPPAAGVSAGADAPLAEGEGDAPDSPPADDAPAQQAPVDDFPGDFRFTVATPSGGERRTTDGLAWAESLERMFTLCEQRERGDDAEALWKLNVDNVAAAEAAGFTGFTARVRRAARRCGVGA